MGFLNSLVLLSLATTAELGYGTKHTKLFYHYPPDPVNVRTLNFFLPADQLSVPCFMSIEIKAAYNSYSGDSSIFGDKWTFNHNIRVRPNKNKFDVLEGDGFLNSYNREKNLVEAKAALIDQLLVAKKKADAQTGGLKATSVYDDYKKQLQISHSFLEEQEAKLLTPKPLGPGKYFSYSRGPSTLELKADGSFVRSFQNGSSETFNKEGRIIKMSDRNGNYISYNYQGDNLVRINDMCGRYVSFSYQMDPALKGLVSSISDSINRELKYSFYPNRRLKSFVDLNKKTTTYVYDKTGNMTSVTPANPAEAFTLEYNDKFEVEKQKGPGKIETRYKRTFIANDANHSISEITKFIDGKMESRELQEYKTREFETTTKFDRSGKEIKKEVRKLSAETGYPVSVLDEKGAGDLLVYDPSNGNLLKRQSIPSGESMEFVYDPHCNQVTKMKVTLASKATADTTFTFDERCNLKEAVETQKGVKSVWITLKYNPKGKIAFLTDNLANKEVAFTYWQYGKPESITLKDTGTLLVKYLPTGEIEKVDTFPHGKSVARFKNQKKEDYQGPILSEVRSALDSMLNYLRPAGLNIGL